MKPEIKQRIEQMRCGEQPEGYKKTKAGILPADWDVYMLGDCLRRVEKPVEIKPNELYTQIGIRSHGKGLFYKEPVTGAALGNKSVFWIEPDCFIVNIVFAWEQAIGKTTQSEVGMIGSHRFPMYRPVNDRVDVDYLISYFLTKQGTDILGSASPGGAGRNKTLGQDRFLKSKIVLPPIEEQQKIAAILTTQDKVIELKEKRLAEKQRQKKYLMQQLLTGKKRLPGLSKSWQTVELGEIFNYIQPTAYLVKTTDYDDSYKTPVLTAGKTFILGYTNELEGIFTEVPVVIFDDFTTATKYVDFPFKVKSSAMKILTIKDGFNIVFAYEAMQLIKFTVGGHERHWISKYNCLTIDIPDIEEQTAIAEVLTAADREMELLRQEIEQEKQKKKALMQLLLTGIVRVNDDK